MVATNYSFRLVSSKIDAYNIFKPVSVNLFPRSPSPTKFVLVFNDATKNSSESSPMLLSLNSRTLMTGFVCCALVPSNKGEARVQEVSILTLFEIQEQTYCHSSRDSTALKNYDSNEEGLRATSVHISKNQD